LQHAVTVRDSTEADVAAISAIYRHHVEHGVASFELTAPSEEDMAQRRAAIVDRGLPYLVAELGGRVGGYAYLGPYRPRPAYRYTVEDSVYVAQGMLGRGIGRSLLGALIERAQALALRQMIAIIGLDRIPEERLRNPSVRLHLGLGFYQAGVIDAAGYKLGRWLDTVIMQRTIGPGASQPPFGAGRAHAR
jgi:phosphinothricin acetyltransferase